ncbi:WYL domain-containing protein [Marinobacter salsuginis]|jgi:hypothetical protein|uniref:Uncharacterized protein n=1 Tax=Marinobacter salsuginis TaxID=418719 RepID=A0A5M3Q6R1_9GAMM|nr:WYL domain-containing protein [Marinobacter salsuginis]GBO90450.1 hypothetical protein MSSD14B_41180 [Marinobacter salsuginis]
MNSRADFWDFSREDRYRAMEVLLQWEGACNASRLSELFRVRRENVTRHIQEYRAEFPGQMDYDAIGKVFRPTPAFEPRYSRGVISEYLTLARRFYTGDGNHSWLDCGPSPHIEPDPAIFRGIISAIKDQQPLLVTYRSWNHPSGLQRRIHPHALAYSGLRWHCRAFDERTESFRDFHLGRIDQLDHDGETGTGTTGTHDRDWNEYISLTIVPNPKLSDDEQNLVRADYGMIEGKLSVQCRRSMAHYVLQGYQVPTGGDSPDMNPRATPLICENLGEIRTTLFQ